MPEHEKINYLEFPATDIEASKAFFSQAFNWKFTDYGPDYSAFDNQGLEGGFFRSDQSALTSNGSALVVFYSDSLAATQLRVEEAGGQILKPVFEFPGGARFHFTDPSGNEFAVWSDKSLPTS